MTATSQPAPGSVDAGETDWVPGFLLAHGLIASADAVEVSAIAGGVSSIIATVERPDGPDLVVKRMRRWLRVPTAWESDPARIVTESDGLRLAGQLVPGSAPDVLLIDPSTYTLVMPRAPEDWLPWKSALLAGDVDREVARWLGSFIGTMHRATAGDPAVRQRFDTLEHLVALRVDAFYGEVARHHPDVAAPIEALARQLTADRRCFVHGDFSPKNVLVGRGGTWVVDYEVAHYGCPLFDLGYMLHHLAMKSLHVRGQRAHLLDAARSFLSAYHEAGGIASPSELPTLAAHIGCLLLARVDGKSPSGYLRPEAEERIRARVPAIVVAPPSDLDTMWEHLADG